MSREVHFEQAVYGSFRFWHRGYGLLARSAGCREEWLDALRLAGQRIGERPTGVVEKASLFALPLRRGPWMIVGVYPQGCDDQGRPGALAFHGLFVGAWDYRRARANPFVLAGALRPEWTASDQDTILQPGRLILPSQVCEPANLVDDRVPTVVEALKRRQRVVLTSAEPIDGLARAVWAKLPARVRRRVSVATWAFSTANRFDLVAVPRLAGIVPEATELVLESDSSREPKIPLENVPKRPPLSQPSTTNRWRWAVLVGLLTTACGWGLWSFPRPQHLPRPNDDAPGKSGRLVTKAEPPRTSKPPAKAVERPLTESEKRGLSESLMDMLESFPRTSNGRTIPEGREPGEIMRRLTRGLRYSGRLLSAQELDELSRLQTDGRSRTATDVGLALRWHALIERFQGDRPLPDDFTQGEPRWQLATLAWSFHIEAEPGVIEALDRGGIAEIVHALADALAVDQSLAASSLSNRYPVLDDYRRFLGSLPRK